MADATTPPLAGPNISQRVASAFRSRGVRFFIMLCLIVAMTIPIFMIWAVVANRAQYNQDAINEVSRLWGGEVTISGPVLYLPVEYKPGVKGTNGKPLAPPIPIIVLPDQSVIDVTTKSELRSRGIFEVPVYSARIKADAQFNTKNVEEALGPNEQIRWDKAALFLKTPARRSFFGTQTIGINGRKITPEPGTPLAGIAGIHMPFNASQGEIKTNIDIGLNGARTFALTPLARETDLGITSDWSDPSFAGAFLPIERNVTDDGFTARWQVPNLALNIPQISRGATLFSGEKPHYRHSDQFVHNQAVIGVRFIQQLDYYQMVERSVKYGVLFIALTFLTLFVLERFSGQAVHAAQLVLIGVAECVFFLLLLSLSEQIGFGAAYLAASGATIALLSYYGMTALLLGRRVWVLTGVLSLLYLTLYLTLKSTDYALLSGSILAFCAVAATMIATRNERWGAKPA